MKTLLSKVILFVFVVLFILSSALSIYAVPSDQDSYVPENNLLPASEASNYSNVSIITPDNVTISASKYYGSSTPETYPNASTYDATLVKSSSYYYNCHSFTWYFGGTTTGLTNAKAFWLNSSAVDKFARHDCYYQVGLNDNTTCDQLVLASNRALLQVGDIVVYRNGDASSSIDQYSHSAVIVSISSSGVYVNSKWGVYGVYRHKAEKCPYATTGNMDPSGGTTASYSKVYVFRPTHNHVDNSIVPVVSGTNAYTLPAFVSINESSHKAVCYCGRGYDLENHTLVQIGTYKYKCSKCGYIYDSSIGVNSSDEETR